MKIIEINKNLANKNYKRIIEVAQNYCEHFSYVFLPEYQKTNLENFDSIKQFRISKKLVSKWPGTELINDKAYIYTYELNKYTVKFLEGITDKFFNWLWPDLPEDLCLLRSNGQPWLVTISHEKDIYMILEEEEKEEVKKLLPGIII